MSTDLPYNPSGEPLPRLDLAAMGISVGLMLCACALFVLMFMHGIELFGSAFLGANRTMLNDLSTALVLLSPIQILLCLAIIADSRRMQWLPTMALILHLVVTTAVVVCVISTTDPSPSSISPLYWTIGVQAATTALTALHILRKKANKTL